MQRNTRAAKKDSILLADGMGQETEVFPCLRRVALAEALVGLAIIWSLANGARLR